MLVAHSSFKYSLSGADRLLGALDGEKIGVRCCQINPLGGNMTLVIDEEMLAKAIKTVYNVFNQ